LGFVDDWRQKTMYFQEDLRCFCDGRARFREDLRCFAVWVRGARIFVQGLMGLLWVVVACGFEKKEIGRLRMVGLPYWGEEALLCAHAIGEKWLSGDRLGG
jgi:hypothetical protein